MDLHKFIYTLVFVMIFSQAGAFDTLDPTGNITVKWDVMSWTPDGYVAVVTMTNFQMYRHIMSPGWTLGWTWAKKEIIWSMMGAQATDQGDCSKFKINIPHCCKRNPTVVDLLPGVPYNQQIANCCKGGVVSSWGQDPSTAVSSFQVTVGQSGTTNKTVRLPKNFTLFGPGRGYTCSKATIVPPSVFLSADGRRKTQAMMTWNVTCTFSQLLASPSPTCCVSMSSFYNSTITPCPTCACGCQNKNNCVKSDSNIQSVVKGSTPTNDNTPLLLCTQHNCPVRVHWHVKLNYKDYWRVKISITNFNYLVNYTQWTLVVQHPNLNNVTQVFSFDYKPLLTYPSANKSTKTPPPPPPQKKKMKILKNDSGMFYGMKFFNDILMEAGPDGNVQSELILEKDKNTFTFNQGWAFPRKVYFNGDECMMPPPDEYPYLPNSALANWISLSTLMGALLVLELMVFW
uniref:COBRA-like protein n=1 Tax=Manihot esculenta TaxID=3983 RepID=A0A2C9VP37_MANES